MKTSSTAFYRKEEDERLYCQTAISISANECSGFARVPIDFEDIIRNLLVFERNLRIHAVIGRFCPFISSGCFNDLISL